jgi:hypothetical protein
MEIRRTVDTARNKGSWRNTHLNVEENTVARNPYAPPKAEVADVGPNGAPPALWNPGAAANWSLLFSPLFGAFLHMKNWEALGQPAKASAARVWAIVIPVVMVGSSVVAVLMPANRSLGGFSRLGGFLLLIAWYASSGRDQMAYVKSNFGNDYPRKGWGKPLLFAIAALFGFFVFAVGLGMISSALRGHA